MNGVPRKRFTASGIGLAGDDVRLMEATDECVEIGKLVTATLAAALADKAEAVEHIGSSSIPKVFAKPLIDVAIRLKPRVDPSVDPWAATLPLAFLGFRYRGDFQSNGGMIYVSGPSNQQLVQVHVVTYDDPQWLRYLKFRNLLRSSPGARAAYSYAKLEALSLYGHDRSQYLAHKGATIGRLLNLLGGAEVEGSTTSAAIEQPARTRPPDPPMSL